MEPKYPIQNCDQRPKLESRFLKGNRVDITAHYLNRYIDDFFRLNEEMRIILGMEKDLLKYTNDLIYAYTSIALSAIERDHERYVVHTLEKNNLVNEIREQFDKKPTENTFINNINELETKIFLTIRSLYDNKTI